MTTQEEKSLNRREIEEAIELLQSLEKDGFYNVPKIIWWLLRYEELYNYAFLHRHDGSCIEGMGCGCVWDQPESRFSALYPALQEVVDLHQYEDYFKKEMEVFEQVRDDHPALMQWLKRNEQLGTEEFILFWIEWLEEEGVVDPYITQWKGLGFKFKAEEWQHTIKFLKVFNEIYWDSDACPKQ